MVSSSLPFVSDVANKQAPSISSLEQLYSTPSPAPASRAVLIVDARNEPSAAEQARLAADVCRRAGLECRLLLGRDATAKAVLELLPKVSIWLCAGAIARRIRNDLPLVSAGALEAAADLLLTGEDRLPAEALHQMNLRGLHLAAISASSSGDTVAPPAAVAGLCNALITAGARQALATLWPVHAAVATDLMLEVLRGVLPPSRLAVSEATRQALLRRHQLGAPVGSWSSFSFALYGTGDALPL